MPEEFLAMMSDFPAYLQPHLAWLFQVVIAAEVLGGLMLIIGWNIQLAVPLLVIITLIAETLVVVNDTGSNIRLLSLYVHFMGRACTRLFSFLAVGAGQLDTVRA